MILIHSYFSLFMLAQVRIEPAPEFSKASSILYHLTKVFLWKNLAFETLHFMDYEKILFAFFTPPQIFFNFFNQNALKTLFLFWFPNIQRRSILAETRRDTFCFTKKLLEVFLKGMRCFVLNIANAERCWRFHLNSLVQGSLFQQVCVSNSVV